MDPELSKYLKRLVKLSIFLLVIIAVYFLIVYLLPLLGKGLTYLPVLILPFILAILLAVLVEPLVSVFESRLRLKRNISAALSLIIVVGGIIYILSLLISNVIKELVKFFPIMVTYSDQAIDMFINALGSIQIIFLQLNMSDDVQKVLQDGLQKGIESLSGVVNGSIEVLTAGLGMLPGFFVFLMIAAVATYLIITDRATIRKFVLEFIPTSARTTTRSISAQLIGAFIGFMKAYAILISITAVITMIALKIIGIEYVLSIGIVVGLLDILPILGPGTLFIPWIIWELIVGNIGKGVSLLVIYLIISLLRQFLEPKIVGDNIGLHPLATLISLYVGLQLGGVVGLIMGPVILVIVVAAYRAGMFDRIDWRKNK